MSMRDSNFDDYVLKIHPVLDKLDYYRLFGAARDASAADIKRIFYAMAKRFHPDRNRDASAPVQKAIYDIYKRINEAYRVLCDEDKRALYHKALAQGHMRLDQDMRSSFAPKKPVDTIRSKGAREMYEKAEQALEAGGIMQAELYAKVALGKEPDSEAVRELLREILRRKPPKKQK
jgi:curved DNA-binding protein CbpA